MAKTKSYKKPLLGKVFYLDVTKYRNLHSLEENFLLLGATLEKCFSKEVHCLVTDNVEYTSKHKTFGTSPSNPSPGTPSPLSAGLIKDSVGSPQAESPGDGVSNNRLTRGQKFLDARKKKSYGTLIENAQKWKIKIITLDKALSFIETKIAEMPVSVKNASNKGKTKCVKPQKKVRKLKGNFLKFESLNKQYKPVQQEFAEFPVTALDSRTLHHKKKNNGQPGTLEEGERAECGVEKNVGINKVEDVTLNTPQPQSTKKKGKASKKNDPYLFPEGEKIYTAGELRRMLQEKIRAEQRKGYCEICEVKYEDIKKHQWSDHHRTFVRNPDNFASLDNMIETGPNFDQFLSDVVKYHQEHIKEGMDESEMEDEVLLIKEGFTSPLVQVNKKKKLVKSGGLRETPFSCSSQKRLNFSGPEQGDCEKNSASRATPKKTKKENNQERGSTESLDIPEITKERRKKKCSNAPKKSGVTQVKGSRRIQQLVAVNNDSTSSLSCNYNVNDQSPKRMMQSTNKQCANRYSPTRLLELNYDEHPRKSMKLKSGNENIITKKLLLNKTIDSNNENDSVCSPLKKRKKKNVEQVEVTEIINERTNFTSQDSGIHISPSSPQREHASCKSSNVKRTATPESVRRSSRLQNNQKEESIVSNSVCEEQSIQTDQYTVCLLPIPQNNVSSVVNNDRVVVTRKCVDKNVDSNLDFNNSVSSQKGHEGVVIQSDALVNEKDLNENQKHLSLKNTRGKCVEICKTTSTSNAELHRESPNCSKNVKQKSKSNLDLQQINLENVQKTMSDSKHFKNYSSQKDNTISKFSISDNVKRKTTNEKTDKSWKEMKRRRKIKKKLKDSWQVLSDRSMRRMFESEGDAEFEGYTAESITESELPLDVSYIDLTEIEYSDNSEVEWIFSEVEEAKSAPKNLPSLLNIVKKPRNNSEKASSEWNEQVDVFVKCHTESKLKQNTRSSFVKPMATPNRVDTSWEAEKIENKSKDKITSSFEQSFEMEKSVIEKHKGNPVEMLNHVFKKYLSGGDLETLWIDPPNQTHLKIQEPIEHSRQVSQDTSLLGNVSHNEGNFDQLSPEIPYVGAKSAMKNFELDVSKSPVKVHLDFNDKVGKENTLSCSKSKSMACREATLLLPNVKKLGEMQETLNFDGLMHSTPLHVKSDTATNTCLNTMDSVTPLGIKSLSKPYQCKMATKTSCQDQKQTDNLEKNKRTTRKSLSSTFASHMNKGNAQKIKSFSAQSMKLPEAGLTHSEDSQQSWQYGIDFSGEFKVDKDIVFNYDSPQKKSMYFSPLKTPSKDLQFLRNLHNSFNSNPKSPNTSAVRNLSGAMLCQAGLEVSTLMGKKKENEAMQKDTKGKVSSFKDRTIPDKKLMRAVSQDLKDGARYKFDYMVSKKQKKSRRVTWYTGKVNQSKKILNSKKQGYDGTGNSDSDINLNEKSTRSKKPFLPRKLLSPRQNRGKRSSDNKSVYSFKSGHTVRLNIMMKKRKRGCLCHEHTPSSKCPNVSEYKKLPTSSPRRSCSRSPSKKLRSSFRTKTSQSYKGKTSRSPKKALKRKELENKNKSPSKKSKHISKVSKPHNSSKLMRTLSPAKSNSRNHISQKRCRSVSPNKPSTPRKSRLSTFESDEYCVHNNIRTVKTPVKCGKNVYEFTSPVKQSPLKGFQIFCSSSKRCLSPHEDPSLIKRSKRLITQKEVETQYENDTGNLTKSNPSSRLKKRNSNTQMYNFSKKSCVSKNSGIKKVAKKLKNKSIRTAGYQLRKSPNVRRRSLRSISRPVSYAVPSSSSSLKRSSSQEVITSSTSEQKVNENKQNKRKRTRSTAELDMSSSSPRLVGPSRKVRIMKCAEEERPKHCFKRNRSPSVSSVSSSVQSDGEKRTNIWLKRLNLSLTDEELCAMFVPTATRSCSSVSSDHMSLLKKLNPPDANVKYSNVENEVYSVKNNLTQRTSEIVNTSKSPVKALVKSTIKKRKFNSDSVGMVSPQRTGKFQGLVLNTPARKAFSEKFRTPALTLSPLTPRTISSLSKIKSPSSSKKCKSSTGNKTPTSSKVSSPILNRRFSLRRSGKTRKKLKV